MDPFIGQGWTPFYLYNSLQQQTLGGQTYRMLLIYFPSSPFPKFGGGIFHSLLVISVESSSWPEIKLMWHSNRLSEPQALSTEKSRGLTQYSSDFRWLRKLNSKSLRQWHTLQTIQPLSFDFCLGVGQASHVCFFFFILFYFTPFFHSKNASLDTSFSFHFLILSFISIRSS